MKIWIPKCGDAVVLDADWRFTLYSEWRNDKLFYKVSGLAKPTSCPREPSTSKVPALLIKGTELVFDRVYVRQMSDDYASITFIIKSHVDDTLIGERFWVKLDDVNTMECTFTTSDNPVGGLAKRAYQSAVLDRKDPGRIERRAEAQANEDMLAAARDAIRAYVKENPGHPRLTEITLVIKKAREAALKQRGWGQGWNSTDAIRAALAMQRPDESGRRSQCFWPCSRTVDLGDGVKERYFSFKYRVGGLSSDQPLEQRAFVVKSKGKETLSIITWDNDPVTT